MSGPITVARIRRTLETVPMRYSSEKEFQDGIAAALFLDGIPFEREQPLDEEDRPDFLVPVLGGKLAIEVKIGGPVTGLERQAARYSAHAEVVAVLIVTPLIRHGMARGSVDGKPLYVVVKSGAFA